MNNNRYPITVHTWDGNVFKDNLCYLVGGYEESDVRLVSPEDEHHCRCGVGFELAGDLYEHTKNCTKQFVGIMGCS
jgi:hypothetical protein